MATPTLPGSRQTPTRQTVPPASAAKNANTKKASTTTQVSKRAAPGSNTPTPEAAAGSIEAGTRVKRNSSPSSSAGTISAPTPSAETKTAAAPASTATDNKVGMQVNSAISIATVAATVPSSDKNPTTTPQTTAHPPTVVPVASAAS